MFYTRKDRKIWGDDTQETKWGWSNCIVSRINWTGETSEENTSCLGGEDYVTQTGGLG